MKKDHNGRQQIPLPLREMQVLMVLFDATSDEDMTTQLVAKRAGIVRNPDCVFVVLGRLRKRGLIKTTHFRAIAENGRNYLFAKHNLTGAGKVITKAWSKFLNGIGPTLRRSIGW